MPRIVNGQIVDARTPVPMNQGPPSGSAGGGGGGCCGGATNPACAPAAAAADPSHGLSDIALDINDQGSYVPPGQHGAGAGAGPRPGAGAGAGALGPPPPKRTNNLPPRHVTYASQQRREAEEQERQFAGSGSLGGMCWSAITYKVRLCNVPIPLLLLIAIPLALGFGWRYEAGLIAAGVLILLFGLSRIWGSRSTSSGNGYRSLNGGGAASHGGRSGPRVRTIGDLPKPPPRSS